MVKLVQNPPLVIDIQLINVATQLVNAMHQRAWVPYDTILRLRELIKTDIQRAIKEIAHILANLSLNVKKTVKNQERRV